LLARLPGRIVPAILAFIGRRLSHDKREAIAFATGLARQYHQLYGRIQLWLILQITQAFAIAINIGFIAAFIILAVVSDPAFGWRSTLLDADDVHRAAEVIAAPWSWIEQAAPPTREQVEATKYSSLDEPFTLRTATDGAGSGNIWAAWWPFLLFSLLFYGLLPRIVTWTICAVSYRRALGRVRLDHAALHELRERLRRPLIDSRAASPDTNGDATDTNGAARTAHAKPGAALPAGRPCAALICPGVIAPDHDLESLIAAAARGEVIALHRLAAIDDQAGHIAAELLRDLPPDTPLCLVVEAWELPVGEYLDLVTALRRAAGRERLIVVLLYHQDPAGRADRPRGDHAEQWQSKLHALGDPYLRTEPLLTEQPA